MPAISKTPVLLCKSTNRFDGICLKNGQNAEKREILKKRLTFLPKTDII